MKPFQNLVRDLLRVEPLEGRFRHDEHLVAQRNHFAALRQAVQSLRTGFPRSELNLGKSHRAHSLAPTAAGVKASHQERHVGVHVRFWGTS